jgi:hypothetical protein
LASDLLAKIISPRPRPVSAYERACSGELVARGQVCDINLAGTMRDKLYWCSPPARYNRGKHLRALLSQRFEHGNEGSSEILVFRGDCRDCCGFRVAGPLDSPTFNQPAEAHRSALCHCGSGWDYCGSGAERTTLEALRCRLRIYARSALARYRHRRVRRGSRTGALVVGYTSGCARYMGDRRAVLERAFRFSLSDLRIVTGQSVLGCVRSFIGSLCIHSPIPRRVTVW